MRLFYCEATDGERRRERDANRRAQGALFDEGPQEDSRCPACGGDTEDGGHCHRCQTEANEAGSLFDEHPAQAGGGAR